MTAGDANTEGRTSPLWTHVLLWLAFATLVIIGVLTVVLPELRAGEEPETQGAETPASAEQPENR